MKKIFKALGIMAASTALCVGIGVTAGCSGGYNGTYYGEYHYMGAHGSVYGMVVEVTVENNIITKVKNITNSDADYAKEVQKGETWTFISSAMPDYGWDDDSVANWTSHECWLMQQYEGRAVADVLEVPVYTDYAYKAKLGDDGKPVIVQDWNGNDSYVWIQDYGTMGEPCGKDWNTALLESGLIVTNATQGSGRVLLAVQNALSK